MDFARQGCFAAVEVSMNDKGRHSRSMRPRHDERIRLKIEGVVEVDMGPQPPMSADRDPIENGEDRLTEFRDLVRGKAASLQPVEDGLMLTLDMDDEGDFRPTAAQLRNRT